MNYNWYEDRRIDLERRLDDLEERRAYLDTDEVRETMIRRAESRDGSYYRTLSAEGQNEYINGGINANQDEIARRMQEISDQLMSINYVMREWNEPPPPPTGFVGRPVLRRMDAVGPGALILPEDEVDTPSFEPSSPIGPPPGYEPGSPDYDPDSPHFEPNSPLDTPPLDTPPFEPNSPLDTPPRDNSIEISRDDVIMGPEIRLDESPEIIDLTTPSPERTPPPRTLRPPPAPSRRRRLIIRSGGKTKRKQKKGQTRKKAKRNPTKKKRRGKSTKNTKKRK